MHHGFHKNIDSTAVFNIDAANQNIIMISEDHVTLE